MDNRVQHDLQVAKVVDDAQAHATPQVVRDLVLLSRSETVEAFRADLKHINESVDLKQLGLKQFGIDLSSLDWSAGSKGNPVATAGAAAHRQKRSADQVTHHGTSTASSREGVPEKPPAQNEVTPRSRAFTPADTPGWLSALNGGPTPPELANIHSPADAARYITEHPQQADVIMKTLNAATGREKYLTAVAWGEIQADRNGGTLTKELVQKLSHSGNAGDQSMAKYLLSPVNDGTGRSFFDAMSDVNATHGQYLSVSLQHLNDVYLDGLNQQLRH